MLVTFQEIRSKYHANDVENNETTSNNETESGNQESDISEKENQIQNMK